MALKITLDTSEDYEGYKEWLADAYRDWLYDENEKYGGENERDLKDNKKVNSENSNDKGRTNSGFHNTISKLFRIPFFREPDRTIR